MTSIDAGTKRVRYAVVGAGHITQTAVLPAFAHATENSRLCALVSDDSEKLSRLSKKYGIARTHTYSEYDRCLRSGEIDAVYIALPNHLHCEYAVRAAQAGIHVLCEKPLAVREQECEQMLRAAEQKQVKLMTAYRLHFEAANLATIELAQSGKLGALRVFDSVFTMSVQAGNVRLFSPELGGGPLYDIGVYCINAARYLFRSEPHEVLAMGFNGGEPRFKDCDEAISATLRFPDERVATFAVSFGSADVSSYRLVGTDGHVRLDPAYEYAVPLVQEVTIGGKTERREFAKRDQFAAQLVYFSSCIQGDVEPEPSGWEGLADVRIVRALHESARIGRPIKLSPFERRERPGAAQRIDKPAVEEAPEPIHARRPST